MKSGTHATPAPNRAHNGSHGETRAFRMGVVSLPSERFTRFGNPAWPGIRTANFAAFGSWPGGLPKNAESLRDSDALMRVAVPQAPRPRWAAWPFFVSVEITVFTLCAQGFPRVRDIGGITTLGVLCVLLKRWTAACQSGYPAILFVPRKSSEINPNSPPILIVPFPTFPGKAIHSGSQSEAGRRSLLMLFLVILRLVDIFPTI